MIYGPAGYRYEHHTEAAMSNAWMREHEQVDKDEMEGFITHDEAMKRHAAIDRDERDAMLEEAEKAYRDVLNNW